MEESIYQIINRMSVEHPGLPYDFQFVEIAGKKDVQYALMDEGQSTTLKRSFAYKLMEKVADCLEKQIVLESLTIRLTKVPILLFLVELSSRIRLCIDEELLEGDKLYSFGMKLATKSVSVLEVELSILILGFFENDVSKQIVRTLGFHSNFTLYALEASKNYVKPNRFAYDLLRNTAGYGKLAALHHFEPVTRHQKEWLIEHGAKNEVAPNVAAVMCLQKPDMSDFFHDLLLTKESFPKLSYLLAYGGELNSIKKIELGLMLVNKYMEVAKDYAKSFIDIAAIVMIENGMSPSFAQLGINIKDNEWSSEKEDLIRSKCDEIISQPRWDSIIFDQMSNPEKEISNSLITKVLSRKNLTPHFNNFLPLLIRDLYDIEVLKFLLFGNSKEYLASVYDYLNVFLPINVFADGPQKIDREGAIGKYNADIWLVYLLKAMRKEKRKEEAFFIKCLSCRFPDVRIEAIHALRTIKSKWSDHVIPALEAAYKMEPVKNVGRRLLRLMGKKDDSTQKEERYIDISGIKVTPSPNDTCLMILEIVGILYKDMMIVEIGDILYLVREPEHKLDKKAILIATEDGFVLGYVPKQHNDLPLKLLDGGEKLYAILLNKEVNKKKFDILIMLSKTQDDKGKVIPFPI